MTPYLGASFFRISLSWPNERTQVFGTSMLASGGLRDYCLTGSWRAVFCTSVFSVVQLIADVEAGPKGHQTHWRKSSFPATQLANSWVKWQMVWRTSQKRVQWKPPVLSRLMWGCIIYKPNTICALKITLKKINCARKASRPPKLESGLACGVCSRCSHPQHIWMFSAQ